jgi:hypothetical protein
MLSSLHYSLPELGAFDPFLSHRREVGNCLNPGAANRRSTAQDWPLFWLRTLAALALQCATERAVKGRMKKAIELAAMSSQSQPLQFDCDAPAYYIVKACQKLGFQSPLDVRWCRMSEFLAAPTKGPGMLGWLFGISRSPDKHCSCDEPLPRVEQYRFGFVSGRTATYLLGQCRRCRTIYWERRVLT